MRDWFKNIVGRFPRDGKGIPDRVVDGFLRVLEQARIQDVPCSEVFARLDEYVDKEAHGEEAARLMPLLREHLDLCSKCCEEYEALLRVLEESSNTGASKATS